MSKWKPALRNMKRLAFTAVFVGVALLLMKLWGYDSPIAKPKTVDSVVIREPFRTIYPLDGSGTLLSFTVGQKKTDIFSRDDLREYIAVIRGVNPKKDDYKLYCRSVIAEIAKLAHSCKIRISVYDSDIACRIANENDFFTSESDSVYDEKFINNHTVAVYEGENAWNERFTPTIYYYRESNNGYSSSEDFNPEDRGAAGSVRAKLTSYTPL